MLAALSEKVPMPTSVETLEMLAARRATIFAWEPGFRKVCFEGDAELAVKSLQTGKDLNVRARLLVKDFTSIRAFPSALS